MLHRVAGIDHVFSLSTLALALNICEITAECASYERVSLAMLTEGFGDLSGKRSVDFDAYPLATKIAFVEPRYFAIEDAINPHMR